MRPEPGGKTAALPRSLLHLQFLIDNGASPDVVLVRDEKMQSPVARAFPGKTCWLGRETVPGRSLSSLIAARRLNRAYYQGVEREIASLGIRHLILFLEGEPLERLLVRLPGIDTVELWEDGLSHYVDLTSDLWYAARGAVQAIAGFYPHRILHRRMDRGTVLVRDRFERANLVLKAPAAPADHRNEALIIGSPLVEDRILSADQHRDGVQTIAANSPVPVRYLPHPREDRARLGTALSAVANLTIEEDRAGLMDHAARHGYLAYLAPVSTGLLDLGRAERCFFVPRLFGLKHMAAVLSGWRANPIGVLESVEALRTELERLCSPHLR
ncbi:hypothetical protein TPR58_13035 [Sphingomonas sp. HF-S3]|uniref:Uncharacterized protein n=1 Tax=Sphingomonas rustica TaxID=3103142 RepID=A0ABV0B956_9SPHN